jgi:arylsulfatase A-like enzyme
MKNFLLSLISFTAILFSANAIAQKKVAAKHSTKPNIIFILTDDLGYGDVGIFFQNARKKANNRSKPYTSTPNIDKLAETGAILPQHYCAAPVCAPARASLLLGVHQGHANVRNNQFDKALENNHTVASVLRTAGYKTAVFGKWGLQGLNNPGPDWPAHPLNRGFDYYLGMVRHADGHEHYPKEGLYRGKKEVWENKTNIADKLDKCYTADLWTAASKKWIVDYEKDNTSQKPFFIYLAYETPHAVIELPTQAYPAGKGLKGGMQWLGEPGHMINTASGNIDTWIHPDYANATYDADQNAATPEVPWPDVYKRYATAVRRIDDAVGDLMQLLKDLKIDKNTMVVFSSDNGPSIESYLKEDYAANFFNSFGPFDGIKRDVWEGGVRVPTIANWPGHIPAHKVITGPSGVYDWLPTFADAAGVVAPARIDGVSLLPSLTGLGKQKNSTVYVEYFNNVATPNYSEFEASRRGRKRNQMQLIRLGDTLGVRYNIKTQQDNFEIYDVAKDPKESFDLAKNAGMDKIQTRMKETVLQMRRPDTSAARPYDDELIPAVTMHKTLPGITWKAFKGNFLWVANTDNLVATHVGTSASPAENVAGNIARGQLFFNGYIDIPKDGVYTFYLTAGSGALLRIHEATVIDEDFGYVAGTEKSGTISLKAGLHPFRLYYALKDDIKQLVDFKWESAGISKQVIPAEMFKHN